MEILENMTNGENRPKVRKWAEAVNKKRPVSDVHLDVPAIIACSMQKGTTASDQNLEVGMAWGRG